MSIILTYLMIVHFIGDWIIQPRHVAKTKKTHDDSFLLHMVGNVLPYLVVCAGLIYLFTDILSIGYLWWFFVNFLSHGFIDWALPSGENERQMINYTALDQILHLSILFLSTEFLIITL